MKKTPQKIEEKVISMLEKTDYSLKCIGKKVGLSYNPIKRIQENAIKEGMLDEKYRRVGKILKYQRDKAIKFLEKTTYSLNKIGKKVGLSGPGIGYIQDDTIKEGILDEKYRRLDYGIVKWQKDERKDKVIKLLKTTDYSATKITKEVNLKDRHMVYAIQNEAIKQEVLDEKYRRLAGGTISYQKDDALKLLKTTNYSLAKIGKEVGLSTSVISSIQENAINKGILDEKYRRTAGGTIKYQRDNAIELLGTTNYNLSKIGKEVRLSLSAITRIQNKAIDKGELDEKYRRLANGIVKYKKPNLTSFLIDYARRLK